MKDDLPARLAAKLVEVEAATRGLDVLLHEAAAAGLIPPHPALYLTAREKAILSMLAEGRTNREIAALLGISVHTVKDHCSSIYRRLGANNRASAITRAGMGPLTADAVTPVRAIPGERREAEVDQVRRGPRRL